MRSSRLLPAAFLVSALSFGQQTTQSPAPDSSVTFRTGAQEVSLDVVVRDAKGKIVKTVKPEDLQVFEDGLKQNLLDFRFVQGNDSPTSSQPQTAQAAPAVVQTAERHSVNDINLICLVFHGLDPSTKRNAIAFAREFVQHNLPPNTWVGVFSLGDNLQPLHEFTNDKREMLQAINASPSGGPQDFLSMASRVLSASPNIVSINVSVTGSGATTAATSSMVITGGEVNLQAITSADVSTSDGANRVRGDQADARREFTGVAAHRNFDSMNVLIDQLAKLPGHKSVLLLSTGMVGLDDPDRMEKMLKKANHDEITFYAVDVTGLDQNSTTLAATNSLNYAAGVSRTQTGSTTSAASNMEKMRQGDYINQGVRQSSTQAVLRQISEDTGGFLIANTNDLRKPFTHIVEDLQTHYEAVYRPADDKLDGRLRTIEVKLNHPGWTVESRTGYYAMPALAGQDALNQADLLGLAALNVKPTPHAFEFESTAFQFRPSGNSVQQAIAFELPVHNLAVSALNSGQQYRIHASALILIKDANGQVVDKFSQDSPFEFPASSLKQAAFSNLDLAYPVNLPPGKYRAEIAVVDQEAHRASVSRFDFESQAPKPLELSSLTLVQRVENVKSGDPNTDPFVLSDGSHFRRVVPQVENKLASNAKPMAYFVVYPEKNTQDKPRIQVEMLVNGKVLARQMSELSAPMPDGSIPMLLGAPLAPGNCELKITATQGKDTITQSLRYVVNP